MAAFAVTVAALFAGEAFAAPAGQSAGGGGGGGGAAGGGLGSSSSELSPASYTQSISCYGAESAGITASGDYFDGSTYTAAHPWYPFGTVLRLTHYGYSVDVVVNDRSPYPDTWDASMAACSQIGMLGVGRDFVGVEVLYMPGY